MKEKPSMKVCVLLPDYSTSGVDYQNYDPVRNLSSLLPDSKVDHVLLNKLTVHRQLKELKKVGYDIFVNLCEGYLDWEVPSIDVIFHLDLLELPYTGPNQLLYDPSKDLMKYVAYTQGVATPRSVIINNINELSSACSHLRYPLFVKPSHAGDSLGIDEASMVRNEAALVRQCKEIIVSYGPLLVEEYVDGREFTVMLVRKAGSREDVIVFRPVEYVFPAGTAFKTYAMKTSELHQDANKGVAEGPLCDKLKKAATDIFNAFGGVGYARLDFRIDAEGTLFFLEINFTCSVFYKDGYEGSADHILSIDGRGQSFFLEKIIEEGLARHESRKKKYIMKGDAIAGYGIYASKTMAAGEVIFRGEEKAQRLATRKYIEKNWSESEMENFRRYAYPVSDEVFILWDEHAAEWAPQNHSCEANTVYLGLNVIANRIIKEGEELTLDYEAFLNDKMEPFHCKCGTNACRGFINGSPGNTIDKRAGQE